MPPTSFSRCILFIIVFFTCALIVYGKGGRGGGGSRGGGWGRSSSSRSSSSSSSSSSGSRSSTSYGSSSSSGSRSSTSYGSSSSSGSGSSYKYGSPSSSSGGSSYKYGSSSSSSDHALTSMRDLNAYAAAERAKMDKTLRNYQSSSGVANYPRQRFSQNSVVTFGSSQQGPAFHGIPNANYPRQPTSIQGIPSHSSFPQPGISQANYPRQSISPNPSIHYQSSSPQASFSNANYPKQPNPQQIFGSSSQQGFQNANYPRQATNPNPSVSLVRSPPVGHQPIQPSRATGLGGHPQSGISNANYPRQQYNYQSLPPQVLGSGVWNPKSGMPAPVYMNYGGLPTGANMYTKPMKKQGFLGSLMSMGGSSKSYKNKHYGSYPSPYGGGGGGGMPANVLGGFMGNKGSKAAMYTILPYMAARKSSKLFRPKFGFYSYRPIRYHSYHHHSYMHEPEYAHYDVYNNDYVGRCNRPIKPDHAKAVCNSTHNQVECDITCEENYRYPDNTTSKTNKCWHVSGTWNPTKNFQGCKPVCDKPCLNGGKCISPGVCGCPSEYRGPRCELHFLKCDIRRLANGTKILWMCTHTKNGTSCRVKCKSPAEFASQSELLFKCTPEGVWTPSTMPLCVVPSDSGEQNVTKIPEEHVTKVTA